MGRRRQEVGLFGFRLHNDSGRYYRRSLVPSRRTERALPASWLRRVFPRRGPSACCLACGAQRARAIYRGAELAVWVEKIRPMTSERWRQAFLDEACGGGEELRRQVQSLLDTGSSENIVDHPVWEAW